MRTNRRERAFTLIEVLLVLMILAGLAAVAVVTFGGREEQSKKRLTRIRLNHIVERLQQYKLDIGHFPTEEEGGLQALVVQPTTFESELTAEKWVGPYLKTEELRDFWDREFRYELVTDDEQREQPHVSSDGPDGEQDTEDDIRSWSEDEALE